MRLLFGDCALDPARRELSCGNLPVHLQPQVFDLLLHLIRNRDHVVSKDELLSAVWHGRTVSESTLSSRINAARSAIGDSGERRAALDDELSARKLCHDGLPLHRAMHYTLRTAGV